MNYLLAAALLMISTSWVSARPLGGATGVTLGGLPEAREGRFPVLLPACSGQVKQLLLLNDRWVVVAVYDVPELVAKVDELSEGRLLKAEADWKASEKAGRPNWTAFKLPAQLHEQFDAAAREALGERKLDEPAAYAISSDGDAAYRKAQPPARVTRTFVSLGGARVPGAHEVDYAHYCILDLPPLQGRLHLPHRCRGPRRRDLHLRRTAQRVARHQGQPGRLPARRGREVRLPGRVRIRARPHPLPAGEGVQGHRRPHRRCGVQRPRAPARARSPLRAEGRPGARHGALLHVRDDALRTGPGRPHRDRRLLHHHPRRRPLLDVPPTRPTRPARPSTRPPAGSTTSAPPPR